MAAQNIDEVIDRLTGIVDLSVERSSRLGYFAALYRRVTINVKKGIDSGFFEDGERMRELDVRFANRYLDAYDSYHSGNPPSQCWRLAFDTAPEYWPVVLQHLLLGMNAHINLDLGIAAARTMPTGDLAALRTDFDRINQILGDLIGVVENELADIWLPLRVLDGALGNLEEGFVNFSLKQARDFAWMVAETLNPLSEAEQATHIERLDGEVARLGGAIRDPGMFLEVVTKLVRIGERGTTPQIIRHLAG